MEEEGEEVYQKKIKEILERKKREEEIKKILAKILDGKAYERMMNVKISNYELYIGVVNPLISLYKRVKRKITDEELLKILRISTERKEGEIKFYRK